MDAMETLPTEKESTDIGWNFAQTYQTLPSLLYQQVLPAPVSKPRAVLVNNALARSLGLQLHEKNMPGFISHLSGNSIPAGSTPIAQAYMGHQFGYPNMLGDGRAILLGEQQTPQGTLSDIQLKGSGPTPYSRRGDGRATLSAMLREYLISEAMHHLGIPTTRSLAVITTGEPVYREQIQEGGILARVAASHIRVGTFEFAARQLDKKDYTTLLDYVIQRHYPELAASDNKALALLDAVVNKQAALIAQWMRVGFIHGVMNTDNMSIAGETIDYGPCAFMNRYNPATVFSSIDTGGRYAFGNQPAIAQWNLAVFASALIPLVDDIPEKAVEAVKAVIQTYPEIYAAHYRQMLRNKLGLGSFMPGDDQLCDDLLSLMEQTGADYTNTFTYLSYHTPTSDPLYQSDGFKFWKQRWEARLSSNGYPAEIAKAKMQSVNPVFIPRNHLVEEALEAATLGHDDSLVFTLLDVLRQPYTMQPGREKFITPPPGDESSYRTFCNT